MSEPLILPGISTVNETQTVIDFDSDEPLVCPLDKEDGETCESCQ